MTSPLTLIQAAKDLDLPYDDSDQDWGIANADATRLSPFVAYYVQHAETFSDFGTEFYLGELLLESANDGLRDGTAKHHDAEAAVHAILARQATEPTQALLAYWMNLDLPDEAEDNSDEVVAENAAYWPVAGLLRQTQADMTGFPGR